MSTREEAETSQDLEKTRQVGEPREEALEMRVTSGPQKGIRPLPGSPVRRPEGLEKARDKADDDQEAELSGPNPSVSVQTQGGGQQPGGLAAACFASPQVLPDNGQVLPGNEKAAVDQARLLPTPGLGTPDPDSNDAVTKGLQLTQQTGEQAVITETLQLAVQQFLIDTTADTAQLDKPAGASQPSSSQAAVSPAIQGMSADATSAQVGSDGLLVVAQGQATAVKPPDGDRVASASRGTAPIQDSGFLAASNLVSDRNLNKTLLDPAQSLDPKVEQPLAKIQQWVAVVAESPVASSRPADITAQPNNSPLGTVPDGVQVASKESAAVLAVEPVLMKGAASLPMDESKSAADQAAKPVATGKSGDPSMTETSTTAKGKAPIPAVPTAFHSDLQNSEKQPEMNLLAKAIATAEIRSGEGKAYQTDSKSEGVVGNPVERTVVPSAKLVSQQPIEPEVSISAKDAATNASLKASHSPTGSEVTPSVERGFQALTGKPAPKTQPLMGQAEAGSGVNPMSRTLPVGAADHSLLERSTSPSDSHFWTQVEKANVVAQLIEKAQLVANSKNSEIVISLKPEFLGRLSLHAAMQDGALMATITAESPAVKTLLESHIPALQQALQEQGLSVSKISVVQGNELSFSGFHPGSSHPHQNFEPQSTPQMPWLESMTALEPEPEETELPVGSVMMPNQSLHLFA